MHVRPRAATGWEGHGSGEGDWAHREMHQRRTGTRTRRKRKRRRKKKKRKDGAGIDEPIGELVDEATKQRPTFRPNELAGRIQHHGSEELSFSEHVTDRATGDAEEGATGETVEEASHEHGLDVPRDRGRHQEDDEEDE